MYAVANFQPLMTITLRVTALQSSKNRKIDLYRKYRENKLQVLNKMIVTYEQNAIQS